MFDLLWELPLGFASLAFYRTNRALLRSLYQKHLIKHPDRAQSWRPISAQMLAERGALPCLMTTGPRWNPHATIAGAGPVKVASCLQLDTGRADASAGEWTVVVHSFPGHQLAGSIGRGHPTGRIDLAPGDYILFLRYYHCQTPAFLPAISVDGRQVVSERAIPIDNNSFYEKLSGQTSWYFKALHWYVFPALKYQHLLPKNWVAHEFLPVGNPETQFTYGHVLKDDELTITCNEECLQSFHVYVTLYNRASFPTFWSEIKTKTTRLKSTATGFYLTRQHLRADKTLGQGSVSVQRSLTKDLS